MSQILLIGKNSLIAKAFKKKNITKISYRQISKYNLKKFNILILCSFPKKYYMKNEKKFNFERKIFKYFKKKKIFYISTSKVYPFRSNCSEQHKVKPRNVYAKNKLKIEKILKAYTSKYIILRISNVFSRTEASKGTFFDTLRKNFLKKKIIFDQKLESKKDFISVSALKKIFNRLDFFECKNIYNIGSGKPIQINTLLSMIFDAKRLKNVEITKYATNKSQWLNTQKTFKALKIKKNYLYNITLKDLKKIKL